MRQLSILVAIACVFTLSNVSAQDIHFSQFTASPLTLNPALTGKVPCTYRATLNYRMQWATVPAPYETYSVSYDQAFFKTNRYRPFEALGAGLLLYNDVSGDGNLKKLNIGVSTAYHKQFGRNHIASIGFQGSLVQMSVDYEKLVFPIQITSSGPDLTIPHGENFFPPNSYIDIATGIHWTSVWDEFTFNMGAAYQHLTKPNETFLSNSQNELGQRYTIHGGAGGKVTDEFMVLGSFLYMYQSEAQEFTLGAAVGYNLTPSAPKPTNIYFGTYYRFRDANIMYLGLDVEKLQFGFSYDINTSTAYSATNGKGAFELTMAYTGCIQQKTKIWICPRI